MVSALFNGAVVLISKRESNLDCCAFSFCQQDFARGPSSQVFGIFQQEAAFQFRKPPLGSLISTRVLESGQLVFKWITGHQGQFQSTSTQVPPLSLGWRIMSTKMQVPSKASTLSELQQHLNMHLHYRANRVASS